MANPVALTGHRRMVFNGLAIQADQFQDSNGVPIGAVQQATIADLALTDIDALTATVKFVTTRVTVGTNDVAVETAIATIPVNSILLSVSADVNVAFDGATTQTFEVGLTGNIDKYIDTADFLPETATESITNQESTTADVHTIEAVGDSTLAIVSTHTNNAGTVGSGDVTVVYIELGDADLGTVMATAFTALEGKINAILVALEDAGILADA